MKGEPIESVKVGVEAMFSALRCDPYALETVAVSIITYDRAVNSVLPLTFVSDVTIPSITCPDSGPTHTGRALQMLCEQVDCEVKRGGEGEKGDWRPLLFIMTDGKPSDLQLYQEMISEVKRRHFARIIACAAGMNARVEPLKLLTEDVFALSSLDSTSFMKFFQWVTDTILSDTRSCGSGVEDNLPAPPSEITL